MELHRHGLAVERAIEPGLVALADAPACRWSPPTTASSPRQTMYEAHDALLCIAEGRLLSDRDRRRVTPEHWFKPAAAMRALFADLPEACDNTLAIARRCAVMAETRKPLLPVCPKVRPGSTEEETVRAMATRGPATPHGRDGRRRGDARALSASGWRSSSTSSPRWASPAIS